jgi:hypothetical protein
MLSRILLLLLLAPVALAADAPDHDQLAGMLSDFLANAGERHAHERFWADDLVYTSSSGARFGKADILQGMDGAEEPPPDAPVTVYTGEDVSIRQYGDTAVVAFRLVGTTTEVGQGAEVAEYFNTGTFLKRDGEWRVVAWQATRIPQEE